MAEPSKRSWPWKKKSLDRAASSPESVVSSPRASPHNGKFGGDEQDVSKILSDHARVSEEAMTQWQLTESKLKQVSDKFHAAQAELTSKDVLVKQHAKVAEEAVTGWEKAEAEAAALKQQLDTTMHQKLATEDRVSHLDGALKECMKQLRHVREEQEQRIHETIVKKTREYDSLRQEMEAKLAEVGLHLQNARSEVLKSRGEVRALSTALEDSTKAFAEVNDLRARSAEEVRILQIRLESTEKECSSLNYELQVLGRELQIRNGEIESERKVTENASKNQLENVKKIAKLEAECHKLRILVRQKLPGPAALAQMKIEAGALERNSSGFDPKRRRSFGTLRSVNSSSRDLVKQADPQMGSPRDSYMERSGSNREVDVLAERLVGMDDELKMLKEALARRDGELQESRLMCAKTASKLSNVEDQLQTALKRRQRKSTTTSTRSSRREGSVGGGVVDAWDAASALLVELDQVKRASDKGLDVGKVDLMDDFAEMERLAMTTADVEPDNEENSDETSEKSFSRVAADFEEKLAAKERELEEANCMCKEVSRQLSQAEEEVASLQSRNRANEADLVTLQEKLDRVCDKQGEEDGFKDRNITKELEDLVEAQSISLRSGAAHEAIMYDLEDGSQNGGEARDGNQRSMSSRSSSEVKYEVNEDLASVLSDADSKASNVGSDLLTMVRKVVRVVAALVDATDSEHELSTFDLRHENGLMPESRGQHFVEWRNPDLYSGMQSLIGTSNKLLQGKADVVAFLAELAAVLNCLVQVIFRARNVDQPVEGIQSPANHTNGRENGDELRAASSEKSSLESQSHAEMAALEVDSPEHKGCDKGASGLEVTSTRSEGMKNHLQEAEKSLSTVLHAGREETELHEWSMSNGEPVKDMLMLHKKVAVLEGELQGERRRHQEVVLKYLDLHQQFRSGSGGSNSASSAGSRTREGLDWDSGGSHNRHQSPDLEEIQVRKDREMQSAAEKLAECQRSILDLGKQLKALSAGAPSQGDSLDALSDTACSVDRLSRSSTDHNGLQLRAHDSDSGTTTSTDLHTRSHSSHALQDISLGGEYSVPSSPFVDRRSSLSPTSSLVRRDGRGSER